MHNPIFQSNNAHAILVDIPAGAGSAKLFSIVNPYFEDNCKTTDSYVIEIAGSSTAGERLLLDYELFTRQVRTLFHGLVRGK